MERSFFNHPALGVIDALLNHKSCRVNFVYLASQPRHFQSGNDGKDDIDCQVSIAAFTKVKQFYTIAAFNGYLL
jgi:hypothetical protein